MELFARIATHLFTASLKSNYIITASFEKVKYLRGRIGSDKTKMSIPQPPLDICAKAKKMGKFALFFNIMSVIVFFLTLIFRYGIVKIYKVMMKSFVCKEKFSNYNSTSVFQAASMEK